MRDDPLFALSSEKPTSPCHCCGHGRSVQVRDLQATHANISRLSYEGRMQLLKYSTFFLARLWTEGCHYQPSLAPLMYHVPEE